MSWFLCNHMEFLLPTVDVNIVVVVRSNVHVVGKRIEPGWTYRRSVKLKLARHTHCHKLHNKRVLYVHIDRIYEVQRLCANIKLDALPDSARDHGS